MCVVVVCMVSNRVGVPLTASLSVVPWRSKTSSRTGSRAGRSWLKEVGFIVVCLVMGFQVCVAGQRGEWGRYVCRVDVSDACLQRTDREQTEKREDNCIERERERKSESKESRGVGVSTEHVKSARLAIRMGRGASGATTGPQPGFVLPSKGSPTLRRQSKGVAHAPQTDSTVLQLCRRSESKGMLPSLSCLCKVFGRGGVDLLVGLISGLVTRWHPIYLPVFVQRCPQVWVKVWRMTCPWIDGGKGEREPGRIM